MKFKFLASWAGALTSWTGALTTLAGALLISMTSDTFQSII